MAATTPVLALNLEGKKEVLGLYLSESEGANFWLLILSDLQNCSESQNQDTGITCFHFSSCKQDGKPSLFVLGR